MPGILTDHHTGELSIAGDRDVAALAGLRAKLIALHDEAGALRTSTTEGDDVLSGVTAALWEQANACQHAIAAICEAEGVRA